MISENIEEKQNKVHTTTEKRLAEAVKIAQKNLGSSLKKLNISLAELKAALAKLESAAEGSSNGQ